MSITHVLAVVPVSDIDRSKQWYTSLFGRPADNNPMPSLVEWQVLPGAWVQANKGVRTSTVSDPDGNTIAFIGGFRVDY
ncbi:MAG: VOC family protein [Mycobacterium sp.]